MIINPTAHTMVPQNHSFQAWAGRDRRKNRRIPGGRQLWFYLGKIVCMMGLIVGLATLWLDYSVGQVRADICRVENQHEQLMTANILMRARKARLFSPEVVGELAGDQLAIHLPESGQYKKF